MASSNPLLRPRNPFERRLIDQVEASKPHHGVGVFERPLPGGRSLTFPRSRGGGGGSVRLPLKPFRKSDGSISITAGLYHGEIVVTDTKTGPAIDDSAPPSWSITDGGLYLGVKYELTTDSGYLVYAEIEDSPFVKAAGSPPADSPSTGQFYQLLALIADGEIVSNYGGYNLYGMLRDNSTEAGSAAALAIVRS
jgi:hypothetical protein